MNVISMQEHEERLVAGVASQGVLEVPDEILTELDDPFEVELVVRHDGVDVATPIESCGEVAVPPKLFKNSGVPPKERDQGSVCDAVPGRVEAGRC